ncbi:LexA family protein [Azospirillum sp. sgz302134]
MPSKNSSEPGSLPIPLTRPQLDVLRVVCEFIDEHGYAPTTRELAEEMEWAGPSTAHAMLSTLAEKGWITMAPGRRRGVTVLHRPLMPDFGPIEFVLSDRTFPVYRPCS